jgi:type IV pilus assembly protein PilB
MAIQATDRIILEKLGRILIKESLLTEDQLSGSLIEHDKNGAPHPVWGILVKRGHVSEKDLVRALGIQFDLPVIDISEITITPEVIQLLPEDIIRRHLVLPMFLVDRELTLAISDPTQLDIIDLVSTKTKCRVQPVLAAESALETAIIGYFTQSESRRGSDISLQQFDFDHGGDVEIERLRRAGKEIPVGELVDKVLSQAVDQHASDIHIEPSGQRLMVRYRIDGTLREVAAFPLSLQPGVVSRIKILSELDTAERQKPQDGRIQLELNKHEFDFRTSIVPTFHGETIVLRIFNRGAVRLGLEELGFSQHNLDAFKRLIHLPSGILLVVGPAASGKSTTLYAALNAVTSAEKNVMTIEDPVEYELPLVNQIQVNLKRELGFATALRATLRQDPDVIMVGEIPDPETGKIATEAALTGHLVLSSLHTNDAKSAVMRLVEMGVEPFLIAPSLLGIVAQRLVRCICPQCKEDYAPKKSELAHLNLTDLPAGMTVCKGRGCAACQQRGYKGRTGIHEVLVVDEAMRELISERAPTKTIAEHAKKMGFTDMRFDGIKKVLSGQTTVEELLRVTKGA